MINSPISNNLLFSIMKFANFIFIYFIIELQKLLFEQNALFNVIIAKLISSFSILDFIISKIIKTSLVLISAFL